MPITEVLFVSAWDHLTGADRPLSDSDLARIQAVYPILRWKLDIDSGLLNQLFAKNCITAGQMEFINGAEKCKKNERLVDVFKRRSYADVCVFFNCLRLTNQAHLADILQHGGSIVLNQLNKL